MGHRQDQEQFSALIAQHAGILRKVAATYCRDPDNRADLIQEISAQLWSSWPRYDSARPFTTWMYRVAINVAITYVRSVYRGAARFVALEDAHLQIPAEAADHDASDALSALEALIAELDPLNRGLLLLYLDDHSHRDMAAILGISESNVATKINRLKQRVRARFA
jgi:RNA polymerase sigma factor (sigma-70 family)